MIKLADYHTEKALPVNMRTAGRIALSYAYDKQKKKFLEHMECVHIWADLEKVSDNKLDFLAVENRVLFYDSGLSADVKRELIRNYIYWYIKLGTRQAVEELISIIYGNGKVSEWFEYGGIPGYFRIYIKNVEDITPEKNKELKKNLYKIKRHSAHLDVIIYMFEYWVKWLIRYENCLTMLSSFYPRCNMTGLFLDGKEYLDGGYLLNGHQNVQGTEPFCMNGEGYLDGRYRLDGLREIQILDYYPVSLLIRGDFQQNVIMSEWLHYLFEVLLSLYAVPAMRTGSCFYPRYNVPLFRLDGTQQLDGMHFLNEMDQDFEQFFLDGETGLDGGYILNGYMDSDNFDFYPVELQMLGDFRQQVPMAARQVCLSPEVLFLAGVEPAIQMRDRFYPRKNIPLLLLNGEAELDGEYLLSGRIDEFSMFYLNGKGSLDGRHFLNGYTGSDDEFYPARLQISGDFQPGTGLSGQFRPAASVQLLSVSGASDILMSGSFYPRYSPPFLYLNGGEELDGDRTLNGYMESDNIPPCSLNGEAGLDGEYALNGYKNNQSLGFYPLNVLVNGCFTQNIMPSGEARLLSDARLSVQSDGCFGVRENAGVKAGTGNVVQMCTWAGEQVSAGRGKLTVEKDLWYLEGRQQLDGQVRLDADSYEIQL